MAKRGSNIYKRKDGRYEGRVLYGYKEDGKRCYRSVYARTLAEVKQKMAEEYAISAEITRSSSITVREAARQWLCSAKLRVKISSYANYENIIEINFVRDAKYKRIIADGYGAGDGCYRRYLYH